ncbi:hypothetical protein [Halorhodospira halochloris]|uniref:hypothetical protein n=1 Tax=Halorhodospira halochloris TaxID=1052 RepID=UPI001EE80174|nr:hypothetical protein [Halorhodospira halochloris]MCG5549011.1 hypothetical protein [Halorhodospira halochloris]
MIINKIPHKDETVGEDAIELRRIPKLRTLCAIGVVVVGLSLAGCDDDDDDDNGNGDQEEETENNDNDEDEEDGGGTGDGDESENGDNGDSPELPDDPDDLPALSIPMEGHDYPLVIDGDPGTVHFAQKCNEEDEENKDTRNYITFTTDWGGPYVALGEATCGEELLGEAPIKGLFKVDEENTRIGEGIGRWVQNDDSGTGAPQAKDGSGKLSTTPDVLEVAGYLVDPEDTDGDRYTRDNNPISIGDKEEWDSYDFDDKIEIVIPFYIDGTDLNFDDKFNAVLYSRLGGDFNHTDGNLEVGEEYFLEVEDMVAASDLVAEDSELTGYGGGELTNPTVRFVPREYAENDVFDEFLVCRVDSDGGFGDECMRSYVADAFVGDDEGQFHISVFDDGSSEGSEKDWYNRSGDDQWCNTGEDPDSMQTINFSKAIEIEEGSCKVTQK